MGGGEWESDFDFGEGYEASFTPRIKFNLKKGKAKAKYYQMRLHNDHSSTTLLYHRLENIWLDNAKKATMYITESTFNIAFQDGERKLIVQLTDPQVSEGNKQGKGAEMTHREEGKRSLLNL